LDGFSHLMAMSSVPLDAPGWHWNGIGFWDTVYLPLRAGTNVLTLAVSETFGGWGVQRFPDPEGVELQA
jgi:hypothetical protein